MTTTFRADEGLAFLLQYENVAWYDAGEVRILDRRVYPAKTEFVTCRTHGEVAQAIRDMVTQSAGPYTAAAMGMALAAYECREKTEAEQLAFLAAADGTISNARPTTAKRMKLVCDGCLEAAKLALREGRPVDLAIREHAVNANNRRYSKVNEIAKYLVPLIPAGGTVMTQCFGETIVGMMLKEAKLAGKDFRLFCPETRPYFQGARLTATVCHDMGFDVTVITDNMPAFVMERRTRSASTAMSSTRSAHCRSPSAPITSAFRPSSPARRISATRRKTPSGSRCATLISPCRPWACARLPRASRATTPRST